MSVAIDLGEHGQLRAELFEAGDERVRVLLAPAMGVPARFYRGFASHLAARGVTVLVPEYRGLGSKAKAARDIRLRDWAEVDLSGALEWLRAKGDASNPLVWIGHSVGGQLFGLLRNAPVARALLIASQSGYWKHWSGASRLGMAFLWHAVVPVATAFAGRLPMQALKQGLDVPTGVAREWASWGKHPRYIGSYADTRADTAFAHFDGSLRAYSFDDDNYAPEGATHALVAEYARADTDVRTRAPSDYGLTKIGHFGAFRTESAEKLWPELTEFVLSGT